MSTVAESTGAKPQLGAGLAEGLNTLSLNQTVTFTLYVKTILPIDGYVFWVNATLLTSGQIAAAIAMGGVEYSQTPANSISVQGSLHHATLLEQERDRHQAINSLVFTSLTPVNDLNQNNPYLMYIAEDDGVQYAFKNQANYYQQADLYHYSGTAVYSVMGSQIINSLTDFDLTNAIVSNSLPFWLALNNYTSPIIGATTIPFTLYPSFLSPENLVPPYATVHIGQDETSALQSMMVTKENGSTYQLVKDVVTIEVYGARNYQIQPFLTSVFNYSLLTDNIGIVNSPTVRDAKVNQTEFGIIAQKKVITFEVSYYQENALNVAQQLITSAFITITPTD